MATAKPIIVTCSRGHKYAGREGESNPCKMCQKEEQTKKDAELSTLGSVLMGKLYDLSIQKKCTIASKAGIDISEVPSEYSNALVNPALRNAFSKLDPQRKQRALPILAEQIMAVNPDSGEELTHLLEQHGYKYIGGTFVPVGLIDEREARHLPVTASAELSKAITRLADNDVSGSISAACGAVDATANTLYEKHGFGKPPFAMQDKVNTLLDRLDVFGNLEKELIQNNTKPEAAKKITEELREATSHAVGALQMARHALGDVHGTKPAYDKIAYEIIKWASSICGLLEGH